MNLPGGVMVIHQTGGCRDFSLSATRIAFPRRWRRSKATCAPAGFDIGREALDSIEHAPGSIADLYRGENLGKRLIRIAPDDSDRETLARSSLPLNM
jgi:hypothetical protein